MAQPISPLPRDSHAPTVITRREFYDRLRRAKPRKQDKKTYAPIKGVGRYYARRRPVPPMSTATHLEQFAYEHSVGAIVVPRDGTDQIEQTLKILRDRENIERLIAAINDNPSAIEDKVVESEPRVFVVRISSFARVRIEFIEWTDFQVEVKRLSGTRGFDVAYPLHELGRHLKPFQNLQKPIGEAHGRTLPTLSALPTEK